MTVAENIRVAVGAEHLRRRDPRRDARRCARCSTTSTSRASRGPRLVAQRRPAAPARAREGVRRLAAAPDPRRADGAALAGLRRAPLRRRPQARRGRNGRRLHHAPPRRGARDRRPCHGPARRQAARDVGRSRTSPTPTCSRMIIGRTLEATFPPKHAPPSTRRRCCGSRGSADSGFENISFSARSRARSSASPASSATASARSCARSPGATASTGIGQRRRQAALAPRPARERRVHAGRPPDRGPDDRPERARELGADRARPAHDRARSSAGAARSTPSSASCPSWPSRRRRSRRRSRRSRAATSRRS